MAAGNSSWRPWLCSSSQPSPGSTCLWAAFKVKAKEICQHVRSIKLSYQQPSPLHCPLYPVHCQTSGLTVASQCFKLGGSFSWRCQTGHDAAPREASLWVPITDVSEGLMSCCSSPHESFADIRGWNPQRRFTRPSHTVTLSTVEIKASLSSERMRVFASALTPQERVIMATHS